MNHQTMNHQTTNHQTTNHQTWYFSPNPQAPLLLAHRLHHLVLRFFQSDEPCLLLFLCIGSDRVTGDSLGPFVGEQLSSMLPIFARKCSLRILGTLQKPIHAQNLPEVLTKIRQLPCRTLTIAIDASIGQEEHVGNITLSDGPLYPGSGLKKNLPAAGQISLTGIVSSGQNSSVHSIQNIRLAYVLQLANSISEALSYFLMLL